MLTYFGRISKQSCLLIRTLLFYDFEFRQGFALFLNSFRDPVKLPDTTDHEDLLEVTRKTEIRCHLPTLQDIASRVQPSSTEFSRVQPSSAEFGRVLPSSSVNWFLSSTEFGRVP